MSSPFIRRSPNKAFAIHSAIIKTPNQHKEVIIFISLTKILGFRKDKYNLL